MLTLIDRLNSPAAQTFHVLQPTSSTITYTVSTRPVPKTLPALVGYYAGILLRVSLGVISILSLWLKFCVTNEARYDPALRLWKMGHGVEAHLVRLAEACQWRYLIPTACIMLFLVFRRNYTGTSLP
jgi:phosphatidylinositol glycan class H protein